MSTKDVYKNNRSTMQLKQGNKNVKIIQILLKLCIHYENTPIQIYCYILPPKR